MNSTTEFSTVAQLIELSHKLGHADHELAILGEGNTSARTTPGRFRVKASGGNLATLDAGGLTECEIAPLVALIDGPAIADEKVDAALFAARTDPAARKPSVEAMFHAWLLTLENVNFVGHTHPIHVNALLSSPHASNFAQRRLFPDEVVCCGTESVLVPYTDPGLPLARVIRDGVKTHIARHGTPPRLVLLENHGLIALGATPAAVITASLMAEKAARITLGAIAAGGARYLSAENVQRIAGRTDEHYRQKALGM